MSDRRLVQIFLAFLVVIAAATTGLVVVLTHHDTAASAPTSVANDSCPSPTVLTKTAVLGDKLAAGDQITTRACTDGWALGVIPPTPASQAGFVLFQRDSNGYEAVVADEGCEANDATSVGMPLTVLAKLDDELRRPYTAANQSYCGQAVDQPASPTTTPPEPSDTSLVILTDTQACGAWKALAPIVATHTVSSYTELVDGTNRNASALFTWVRTYAADSIAASIAAFLRDAQAVAAGGTYGQAAIDAQQVDTACAGL